MKKGMKKKILFSSIYIGSLLYFLFQGGRTSMMVFVIINIVGLYLLLFYTSGKKIVSAQRLINNDAGKESSYVFVAGQSLEGRLSIDINLWLPPPFMQIDECLERHDGTTYNFGGIITTGFKGLTKFRYKFEHMPRGLYAFKPIACTSYDAFGVLKLNATYDYSTTLKVLPQQLSQDEWKQLFFGYKGEHAFLTNNPLAKESTQQAGVREYHYGDKITRVHWNATARTGQWKSKNFEKESVPRTMVILDCYSSQIVDGIDVYFELAVSTATSLFEFGLKQHSAFGLVTNSEEVFVSLAQIGELHYSQVMNHLTTVAQTNKTPMSQFLNQMSLEKTFAGYLFIVTSEIDEKMLASFVSLKRRGYEPYLFYVPTNDVSERQKLQLNVFRGKGFNVFEVPSLYLQSETVAIGGAVG